MNDFITLTALGEVYGVSAQVVGRWLKGLGLREGDGQPSDEALLQGFVLERPLDHGGYFFLWHRTKTCYQLDMMGYPRGGPAPVIEQHDGFTLFRA